MSKIYAEDIIATYKDKLQDARDAKQEQWVCYFESALEDLWCRNLAVKCECGEYQAERGECKRCQEWRENRESAEKDYQSRNF